MKTTIAKFAAALSLVLVTLSFTAFTFPSSAHVTQKSPAQLICSASQHIHVMLHGNRPATARCENGTFASMLAMRKQASHAVGSTPNISQDGNCSVTSMWLFDNQSLPGTTQQICFTSSDGIGVVNLINYSHVSLGLFGPYIDTWQDKPTSYFAGCSSGSLYTGQNRSGSHIRYAPYANGNINPVSFPMQSVSMDIRCS